MSEIHTEKQNKPFSLEKNIFSKIKSYLYPILGNWLVLVLFALPNGE